MTERERLKAEIAERQARLAELDAEPDWGPAADAYWAAAYPYVSQPVIGENREKTILGLIAAQPFMPVQVPFDLEALAARILEMGNALTCMEEWCELAIRETINAFGCAPYGKVHTDGSRSGGQPVGGEA